MPLPEAKVLEKLNAVATAKRLANMVCLLPVYSISAQSDPRFCFRRAELQYPSLLCAEFLSCGVCLPEAHPCFPLHTTLRTYGGPVSSSASYSCPRCAATEPRTLTQTFCAQELHDSDFGKREEVHKIKRTKRAADLQDGSLIAAVP